MSSTEVTAAEKAKTLELVLIQGDLSKLTEAQRVQYYMTVCESVGLNPYTRPFEYIYLNGKLVLYAKRDATDQLRKIHGISVKIVKSEMSDGLYIVVAEAKDRNGREDSSLGAVAVGNLKGDAYANAIMKAETKAKRRVTLSICGLGMLDETEVDSIPQALPKVRPEMTAQALTESEKQFVQSTIDNLNAEEVLTDGEWRIPSVVKKFAGKTLRECDQQELAKYVVWSQGNIKFPSEDWKEFWVRAEEHLGG